ncbi:TerD family protein, partial [Salmonella sp. M134]|uniref:TerD family protein n=1 Tax=Salmonella sp. M134 TaxID=3240288 RepID=UPI00352A7641
MSDTWFVFYNNLSSPDGSIRHSGDSRDGSESDGGDDEIIVVDLASLPPQVEAVRVLVTIDEGEARGQTFGQVPNSYVRVV